MKKFDPNKLSIKEVYHIMISAIAPRPIAFVGSIDNKGKHNLAPYSFFNAFGANPPIIGFSPTLSGRTGKPKDTLINVTQTKEFTVSIVNKEISHQVSLSSCEYASDIDEFKKTGLTKYPSQIVSPYGVKESPVIMECELVEIIELGNKPASGNLILGKVVLFHVNDKILKKNKKEIEPVLVKQIARNGGNWYSFVENSMFEITKPKGIGIGFDNLPQDLLNSNLTGNQLAQLASFDDIKVFEKKPDKTYAKYDFKDLIEFIADLIDKGKTSSAWQVFYSWKNFNE